MAARIQALEDEQNKIDRQMHGLTAHLGKAAQRTDELER